MYQLIGNTVTFTVFFVPLSEISLTARNILKRVSGEFDVSDCDLTNEIFLELKQQPGGANLRRVLLFSPAATPGYCVFLSNRFDGWLTLVNSIATELMANCVTATISSDDCAYPINVIRVYEKGSVARLVRVMREDKGWEFFEKGKAQWFENRKHYTARRVKDRLDRTTLIGYLVSLGISIDLKEFWETCVPAAMIRERAHANGVKFDIPTQNDR